jgi:serine/threonine protein kinase
LLLIDWGSAEFYEPRTEYTVRVGRGWKAPELLLHHGEYDYGVDMWQVGAMLAGVVFRREPFFHGVSNADQLDRIARVLGTSGLRNYVERYDMEMADVDDIAVHAGRPWTEFVNDENRHLAEEEAIDLLDKLLRWDHKVGFTLRMKLVVGGLLTMMSLGSVEREAGIIGPSLLPRGRLIVGTSLLTHEFYESGVSVLLLTRAKQLVQGDAVSYTEKSVIEYLTLRPGAILVSTP